MFDLASAMAVREREDGLLEKDTFDLTSATPIETVPEPVKQNWELLKDPSFQADWELVKKTTVDQFSAVYDTIFPEIPQLREGLINIANAASAVGRGFPIFKTLEEVSETATKAVAGQIPVAPFTWENIKAYGRKAVGKEELGKEFPQPFVEDLPGNAIWLDAIITAWYGTGQMKAIGKAVKWNKNLEIKAVEDTLFANIGENLSTYEKIFAGKDSAGFPIGTPKEIKIKAIMEGMKKDPLLKETIFQDTFLRVAGRDPSKIIDVKGDVLNTEILKNNLWTKAKAINKIIGNRGSLPITRVNVGEKIIFEGRPGTVMTVEGKRIGVQLIGDKALVYPTLSELVKPKVLAPAPKEAVLPTQAVPGEAIVPKEEVLPTGEGKVIPELQPLAEEVSKYKTSEEFVNKIANLSGVSNKAKMQTIELSKLSGTDYPELDEALKTGKLTAQEANDLIGREEMVVKGNKISTPISVGINSDGTYYLLGGNNRVAQAIVNGDKTINAISNDFKTGQTLSDFYKQAKLSTPTGQKPPVEPPKTAVSGEPEGELPKKKPLSERVAITNVSREALKEVDIARSRFIRRIRKYSNNYLAEELKELPTHYITKEGGITPDEAIDELHGQGVNIANENELVDYLKNLDAQRKSLIQDIEQNKPELETHYETTLEKEKEKVRLQEQNKAFREMKKMAEEDAKTALKMQKQALKEGKKIGAEIRKQKYFGSEVTPQQRKELYVVALKKGVIYTDYVGKQHDKLQGIIRYYKGASFDQLKEYINSLSGDPDNPAKLFKLYGNIDRDAEALKIINKAKEDWQDINKVELYSLDPYRTVEKVSKIPVWADNVLADNTTGVIAAADDAMIDRKALEHKELDENREGILSGSKESAELMRKFETKEPLTPKEQRVTDFLRSKYDAFIKEANEMRALVGKKPIPYRKDYMTHIVEQNVLNEFFKGDERGMKGIAQGQLDAIRKGDYTKGNMPFNKFAQQRLTDKTKYDAIGNFLQYVGVITKEIYYTPAISHVRKFIEYALDKLPNAYKSSDRMLSDLQGKTSIADQNVIGAFASSAPVKWMRSHIARSALVGNINFWATNLSNFAISYDELGNYMNVGMGKFLGSKEWRKFAFENSLMLKGRSIDPDFIDQPIHTKLEEFVGSITNLIEYNNVGSTFVGAYLKGIEQLKYSKEQAIEYADAIARRTQVGYKKYELNAWMRSNSGMLMSQFQSWTFNAMNHILYDLGVASLPKDIASMFTDNKTNRVRWGPLLTLIATAITTNYIYEKVGLRKPLDIGSAIPSVSGINKARYQDIGPVAVGKNVAQIFTAKKKATKIGAAVKAATAFVPGGTQIKRFIEGKIFPPGQKPKAKKKSL